MVFYRKDLRQEEGEKEVKQESGRKAADTFQMKQKNKILEGLFAVFLLGAIACRLLGYSPLFIIVIGVLVLFLFYVLWDMPPKHKTFSYKDQQRAMRAFDRGEQVEHGKTGLGKRQEEMMTEETEVRRQVKGSCLLTSSSRDDLE